MTRRFIDAPYDQRCQADVKLGRTIKSGSNEIAQCGRFRKLGDLCTQHAKMVAENPGSVVFSPFVRRSI